MKKEGSSPDYLSNQLSRCTVLIEADGNIGTGFFVAPGEVLTCAHVVNDSHGNTPEFIRVIWMRPNGKEEERSDPDASIVLRVPDLIPGDTIFPDLALLKVKWLDNPCVLINHSYRIQDKLYIYGHPVVRPQGDGATVEIEGDTRFGLTDDYHLLKLKGGQLVPGISGAPALNLRTGAVCGMVKRTRDEDTDLGGYLIRADVIFTYFPELKEKQERFHESKRDWKEAQALRRMLPNPPSLFIRFLILLLLSMLLLAISYIPWSRFPPKPPEKIAGTTYEIGTILTNRSQMPPDAEMRKVSVWINDVLHAEETEYIDDKKQRGLDADAFVFVSDPAPRQTSPFRLSTDSFVGYPLSKLHAIVYYVKGDKYTWSKEEAFDPAEAQSGDPLTINFDRGLKPGYSIFVVLRYSGPKGHGLSDFNRESLKWRIGK
jgi:hypothetical protein